MDKAIKRGGGKETQPDQGANRIYYIPTALVYLGYSIEYDNDNTVIKMLSNYGGAFIDSRKGKFILRTPDGQDAALRE